MNEPRLRMKRVYDPAADDDGMRVLVDRLWPRGVSKAQLALDLWARDLAPSHALRQWYHRQPGRFAEFRQRYLKELAEQDGPLRELSAATRRRTVTLLTAAKEIERSHVVVLHDALLDLRGPDRSS